MRHTSRQRAGFTLIELLMVIALVSVLAAVVLPSAEPSLSDQLRAMARILATDLAYARSLAVTNHSTYRVVFDVKNNRYLLEHSGSNPTLDLLPESPFSRVAGPQRQMVVALDELPSLGTRVRLEAVVDTSARELDDVEFGPLGETTRSGQTIVWLSGGSEPRKRYTRLVVHPATGLTEVGGSTEYGPAAGVATPASP